MYPINIQACGRFINSNAITKMANSSSKSPELLAKYCDSLLKKSSKNPEEAELEDTLNQVVSHRNNLNYPPPLPPYKRERKYKRKLVGGGCNAGVKSKVLCQSQGPFNSCKVMECGHLFSKSSKKSSEVFRRNFYLLQAPCLP